MFIVHSFFCVVASYEGFFAHVMLYKVFPSNTNNLQMVKRFKVANNNNNNNNP